MKLDVKVMYFNKALIDKVDSRAGTCLLKTCTRILGKNYGQRIFQKLIPLKELTRFQLCICLHVQSKFCFGVFSGKKG